jgi:hypothetical protein
LTEAATEEICWDPRVDTVAAVTVNVPIWAVKEEIELPVYRLTAAATEEICWDPRVDTVAFVTVNAPT